MICKEMPLMRHWLRCVCNECDTECDQESSDPKRWLYETPVGQLCWDCMMDLMEIRKVETDG